MGLQFLTKNDNIWLCILQANVILLLLASD